MHFSALSSAVTVMKCKFWAHVSHVFGYELISWVERILNETHRDEWISIDSDLVGVNVVYVANKLCE